MAKTADSSEGKSTLRRRVEICAVLILRVLVGLTFILSGYAKGIDPWGTVYKITEYLDFWGFDIPGALITFATFALSTWEFVWGTLLLLGCYRRVAVICLTLVMAFMLPLTLYIVIFDPVADCGCFGDLYVISNTATLIKNVVIMAALIYLLAANVRVGAVYTKHTQWIVGGLLTFYLLAIAIYGYNVQPLQDFRRFAPGTELLKVGEDGADEESGEEPVYAFLYERDGEKREFSADELPDSTWSFVDRILLSGSESAGDGFSVMIDGEDILPELINTEAEQFIVTIPDVAKVDISYTNLINDLNDYIEERGGSLVTFLAGDEETIDYWTDISMASYGVYQVEPNLVRELARGTSALVYLDKGRIIWKRTLSSVDFESASRRSRQNIVETLDPKPQLTLMRITSVLVIAMLVILAADFFFRRKLSGNKTAGNSDTNNQPKDSDAGKSL